jgi:hypothetical protein
MSSGKQLGFVSRLRFEPKLPYKARMQSSTTGLKGDWTLTDYEFCRRDDTNWEMMDLPGVLGVLAKH